MSANTEGGASNADGSSGGASDASTGVVDGSSGLGSFSCASFTDSFFCADFDEGDAVYFMGKTPIAILNLPDGSITQPFVSTPAAFWSDGAQRIVVNGTSTVTYMHASFAMRFGSANTGTSTFAEFDIIGCVVTLEQATGSDRINLKTSCQGDAGSNASQATILSGVPASNQWYVAELTADFANSTATAVFDGHSATVDLPPSLNAGGQPRMQFGPSSNANRVGMDNILAVVRP